MKCPFCGEEMIHGRIVSKSDATFTETIFLKDGEELPKEAKSRFHGIMGIYSPSYSNMTDPEEVYECEHCMKIVSISSLKDPDNIK